MFQNIMDQIPAVGPAERFKTSNPQWIDLFSQQADFFIGAGVWQTSTATSSSNPV